MHFEGRASRSYNRCAKRPVEQAVLLQAEEHLFTLATFHTANIQLSLTGPYRCRRAAGVNSLWRKAAYFSPAYTFEYVCHVTSRGPLTGELILPPCFRTFKSRMNSLQVGTPSSTPLVCQLSDPKATEEMQSDVQLNMQSFSDKRKAATCLTSIGGPNVFNCMTVHS